MFQDLLDTQDAPLERFLWNSIIPSLLITSFLHADVVWGSGLGWEPQYQIADRSWMVPPCQARILPKPVYRPGVREPFVRVGSAWVVGGESLKTLEVGYLQALLTIRSAVPETYPREFIRSGLQGTVLIRGLVDEHGTLLAWLPVSAHASHPDLVAVALSAVSRVAFHPAHLDGNSVAAVVDIPVEFVIPK